VQLEPVRVGTFSVGAVARVESKGTQPLKRPRLNPDGSLDIFQGRGRAGSQWQGAQIFDVPGAPTARILQRFDGNGQMIVGFTDHDYNVVRTFPSPWYPDGG